MTIPGGAAGLIIPMTFTGYCLTMNMNVKVTEEDTMKKPEIGCLMETMTA